MNLKDNTLKTKAIFNYYYQKAQEEGISDFTVMKALKLVYFAHAWYLGFKKEPLIDENIEAWQYGAVIPSLYNSLKKYGNRSISSPIYEKNIEDIDYLILNKYELVEKYNLTPSDEYHYEFNEDELAIMDSVWNSYKGLSAFQMSNIIHQEGTPWSQTEKENHGPRRGLIIKNSVIKDYYEKKING